MSNFNCYRALTSIAIRLPHLNTNHMWNLSWLVERGNPPSFFLWYFYACYSVHGFLIIQFLLYSSLIFIGETTMDPLRKLWFTAICVGLLHPHGLAETFCVRIISPHKCNFIYFFHLNISWYLLHFWYCITYGDLFILGDLSYFVFHLFLKFVFCVPAYCMILGFHL